MSGYYVNTSYKSRITNEVTRSKHFQYRCRRKKEGTCSGSRSISEKHLEKAFLEYLETYDFENYFDEMAIEGDKKLNKKVKEIDIEGIELKLKKLESRKRKWQYAWTEEIISDADFKERMNETNEEETKLKCILEEVPEKEETYNKQEIITALKDIKENWLFLERPEKKNLVDNIVSQIHCHHMPGRTGINVDRVEFKLL